METVFYYNDISINNIPAKKDYIKRSIGTKIMRQRIRIRMSQEQLGKYIGKSKDTISKYERGITNIPVAEIPIIAEALSIKLIDLFISTDVAHSNNKSEANNLLDINKITPKELYDIFVHVIGRLTNK